jgi:hypothetical protein
MGEIVMAENLPLLLGAANSRVGCGRSFLGLSGTACGRSDRKRSLHESRGQCRIFASELSVVMRPLRIELTYYLQVARTGEVVGGFDIVLKHVRGHCHTEQEEAVFDRGEARLRHWRRVF